MRLLSLLIGLLYLAMPAGALEIEAPAVPEAGNRWMPQTVDSIPEALLELVKNVVTAVLPDLKEVSQTAVGIMAILFLISLLGCFSGETGGVSEIAGTIAVSSLLLFSTNSMISLASDTVLEIMDYGKLLLPVMTAALAAQGGMTVSAAVYAGTAFFSAVLQAAMKQFLIPGVYLYLALHIGGNATGESLLRNMADLLKGLLSWLMKIMIMVFTTYLSLTGVLSGTTDAAAMKTAKVAVSTFVPVVGGVLSDASEAVLISTGIMKNAAGVYGIMATLAIFLHPFLRIGVQYLTLKATAAVGAVFGNSGVTGLVNAFGAAMGLLLGMTASGCIMVLISTVCFMKGVS